MFEQNNKIVIIIILLFFISIISLKAQDFSVAIHVEDPESSYINLNFGMSPYATDGYDATIDTVSPTIPPVGVWWIYILGLDNEAYWTDMRESTLDERIFEFRIVWGDPPPLGTHVLTFTWDTTGLSNYGSFILEDKLGMFLSIDMTVEDTLVLNGGDPAGIVGVQIRVNANEVLYNESVRSNWNFISLPLKVTDSHYLSLFPNAIPGTLLSFDGSGYIQSDSLERGKSYWLKFPNTDSISISGGDFGTVDVALDSGWNMISGVSRPVALSDINDSDNIIIPGTLFGFDGTYTISDTLHQGRGYWLRTFSAGQVTISCVASLQHFRRSLSPPVALYVFPSLQISDASGASQTLYFDVELENSKQKLSYSLPPVLPGIFDARFKGDYRIAEGEEAVIQVQSSSYPITIIPSNLPIGENNQYVIQEMVGNEEVAVHSLKEGESIEIKNPNVRQLKLTKSKSLPENFIVEQNYPNPFNPTTTIKYAIPNFEKVEIVIYNMLGQKVKTLVSENKEAGYYEVVWDGTNKTGQKVSSGIYYYLVRAGKYYSVKKMVLLK